MSHSTELRAQLVQSIEQAESEIVALRSALAALDSSDHSAGPAAQRRTAQPRAAQPRSTRRRSRRTSGTEIVPAGKIESMLGASAGITTAELARQTNGGHEQILSMLKELEQAGKAHRSGTRRSTRWHAGAAAQSNGDTPAPARTSV
jgi:hypothetical protein